MKVIKAFMTFKQNLLTKQITRSILIMSLVFLLTKSMSIGTIYADFQSDIDQANGYVERESIPVIEEEQKYIRWVDLSEKTRERLEICATIAVILVVAFLIGYFTEDHEMFLQEKPDVSDSSDEYEVPKPKLFPMEPTGPKKAPFAVPVFEIK